MNIPRRSYADFKYWIRKDKTGKAIETGINNFVILDNKGSEIKGNSMTEFLSVLERLKIRRIWLHGGSEMQAEFIKQYLMKKKDIPYFEEGLNKDIEKGWTSYINETGKIYSISIKWYDKAITKIMDSSLLVNSKIEDIAKQLNVNLPNKDDSKYLVESTKIIMEFMEETHKHNKFGLTIGATSKESWKQFMIDNEFTPSRFCKRFGGKLRNNKVVASRTGKTFSIHNVLTKEQWIYIKDSFYGGINAFKPSNQNKTLKGNVVVLDFNKMYTSILMEKLPYGKPLTEEEISELTPEQLKECVKLNEYRIDPFKKRKDMEDMMNHFPKKIGSFGSRFEFDAKNRYVDESTTTSTIRMWEEEFEEIKKTYDINSSDYHISHSFVFKTDAFAKSWIIEELKVLHKAEEENNKPIIKVQKDKINSFFGKLGQNPDISSTSFHIKNGKLVEYTKNFIATNEDLLTPIHSSSYTASQGRIKLIRFIRPLRQWWTYSDTDSGIFIFPDNIDLNFFIKNRTGLNISESEIGALKKEYEGNKIRIIKPKTYIIELINKKIIVKASGVSKVFHKNLNFDNFKKGTILKNAKIQKSRIKGGKVEIAKDITL